VLFLLLLAVRYQYEKFFQQLIYLPGGQLANGLEEKQLPGPLPVEN